MSKKHEKTRAFSSQNAQSTRFGELLEVEMLKKCTLLWREAHFQVKSVKNWRVRTTVWRSDVEKVCAVVARGTVSSQKCTKLTDHFWRFRWRFAWQAEALRNWSRVSKTWKCCSSFDYNHPYTTLDYTTIDYTTLRCTIFNYTTLQLQLQLEQQQLLLVQLQLQLQLQPALKQQLLQQQQQQQQQQQLQLHHTTLHQLQQQPQLHYTTLH